MSVIAGYPAKSASRPRMRGGGQPDRLGEGDPPARRQQRRPGRQRPRHADGIGRALGPDEIEARRREGQRRHVGGQRAEAGGDARRLGPRRRLGQERRVQVHRRHLGLGQRREQRQARRPGAAARVEHPQRPGKPGQRQRPERVGPAPRRLVREPGVQLPEERVHQVAPAAPATGAPSRISFQRIASCSAWKLASTMLAETPTVDQRRPCAVGALDQHAGHRLGAAGGDAHPEIHQLHVGDVSPGTARGPWPARGRAR